MALWTPTTPEATRTFTFLDRINAEHSLSLSNYFDLYKWSTAHIDKFWSAVWDETDIIGFKGDHVVDTDAQPPENPPWFTQAQVNYAENMLRCRSSEKTALVQASMFSLPSSHTFVPSRIMTMTPPVTQSNLNLTIPSPASDASATPNCMLSSRTWYLPSWLVD